MRSSVLQLAAGLLWSLSSLRAAEAPSGVDFFESKIRPLLEDTCVDCHGANKQKGDLRLDSSVGWKKGGASGAVIVPGKPDDSLLISAVRYWDKNLQMPPKHALEPDEVNDLIQWVKLGAPDPRTEAPEAAPAKKVASGIDLDKARQHWAYQPVQNPALPEVQDKAWVHNEVDLFTLARMEKAGVKPAPDASKETLLRRVTYDLIGLPPTPEEIAAFESDSAPDAFAKVVDRLLASPHYGERWGRHWLDLARYADTSGNSADFPIPQAYKYRDYVLQAFNNDLPYNEFVEEQIAGDLLPAATEADRERHIVATGFLAMGLRFGGGEGNPHLTIGDAMDTMGRGFLGLSIGCARCHDHKFDPISNRDYYALYGIFSSSFFPHPGSEGKATPENLVPLMSNADIDAAKKTRQEQLAAFDVRIKAAEEAKAASEQEPEAPEKKSAVETAARALADLKQGKDGLNQTPLYPLAYSVSDRPNPGDTKIQVRGDPLRLGEEVPRGFLAVLGGQTLPPEEKGSGRLELAQWIADPANPLTARVMVNRVWQNHFGRGIVATPSDFGVRGIAPTHPELLDFLATKFVEGGWSLKALHRLLLLSHTWQQASTGGDVAQDPPNALWSRFERSRLDAESIRDTLFYVGNDLDLTPGGEHPFPPQQAWGFTQHNQFFALYDNPKRSVYQMQQRLRKHPFFALFDGADTTAATSLRVNSTTPLQSLFAMNDPFVHERADRLASRLEAFSPDDAKRIEFAFLTLYGRAPAAEETEMCAGYLTKLREKKNLTPEQAWSSLSRVLLSANEFLYLD